MSALRLICAGASLTVCVLYGAVKRSGNEILLENVSRLHSDIRLFSNLLRSRRLPLSETADIIACEGELKEMWASASSGIRSGKSFEEAYRDATKPVLSGEAEAVMSELASGLGKGDIDSELERLEAARDALGSICAEMRNSYADKNRLIRSLSMLTGIAAALLLL